MIDSSGWYRRAMVASLIAWVVAALVAAWSWFAIPAGTQVPVHWGADGTVDRMGSKAEGILIMPAVTVFLSLLFMVLPRLDAKKFQGGTAMRSFAVIWIALLVYLTLFQLLLTWVMVVDPGLSMSRPIMALIGSLFVVIGLTIHSVPQGDMMGLRTKWTLQSAASWRKTHALMGRSFMGLGVLVMLLALGNATGWMMFAAMVGGVVMIVPFGIWYSWAVWKSEQSRGGVA